MGAPQVAQRILYESPPSQILQYMYSGVSLYRVVASVRSNGRLLPGEGLDLDRIVNLHGSSGSIVRFGERFGCAQEEMK